MIMRDNLSYVCRVCKEQVPEHFFKMLEHVEQFGFTRDKWEWAINYMKKEKLCPNCCRGMHIGKTDDEIMRSMQ